jgi:hypothetical protein
MTEDFYFVRPKTGQRVLIGQRPVANPTEKIFTLPPRIGLVISTFGSPLYVALALAVRKRFYPALPVLVHDDASPEGAELADVCERQGADFETNSANLGHEMGDLSGIVGGLRWAQERGVELLVRMTRRFVPLVDWTAGLSQLALAAQNGTYGRECRNYGLPLRSECMAMYVPHWSRAQVAGEIEQFMLKSRVRVVVEKYLYTQVAKVYELNCGAARAWEHNIRSVPRLMYAPWEFVEPNRKTPSPNYLWHETASPERYAEAMQRISC